MKRTEIDLERLRSELAYDPSSGAFTWIRRRSPTAPAGSIAGTITKFGYRRIRLDQQTWMAHVLAWAYQHGRVPELDVDHINRDRLDNRIENLRIATRGQNNLNSDYPGRRGKMRGVTKSRYGRWYAQISINGKWHYLGIFDSSDDAHVAYDKALSKRT